MRMTEHLKCLWGLYPILDTAIAGVPHVEAARQVLQGGAKVIQLRDKTSTFEELLEIGTELRSLTREAGAALIVNDNPYLAREIDADGVHLGQEDFPPYFAREILGPEKIIGLSTHSRQQALAAVYQPINYLAIGPVYGTKSKKSEYDPLGVDLVEWVTVHVHLPVVAIGGITKTRIRDLITAGVENVAVISEIMSAPDLAARTRELVEEVAASYRAR